MLYIFLRYYLPFDALHNDDDDDGLEAIPERNEFQAFQTSNPSGT